MTTAIGERIYRIRTYLKISQATMSTETEIAPMQFSRIERGLVAPTKGEIAAIAGALNLKPSELVGKANFQTQVDRGRESGAMLRQMRVDIDNLLAREVVPEKLRRRPSRTMTAEELRKHRAALAAAARATKQIGSGQGRVRTKETQRRLQEQAKKIEK